MQSYIYRYIISKCFAADLGRFMKQRLGRIFSFLQGFEHRLDIVNMQLYCRQVHPVIAFCAVRTWTANWITARRMQQSYCKMCVARCEGNDSFAHTVLCGDFCLQFTLAYPPSVLFGLR